VLGKFLLVVTVSLTTAVVSLASYAFTASRSAAYMQQMTSGQSFRLSFTALGAILLVSIPLAVLFASGIIAISLFAKNYKEAQGYVGPLVMVVVLPAMAAMLPGVELNTALALIPIANVSLVMKELLTGSFPVGFLIATFASSALYAFIALSTAFQLFQREDVLFRN
jgi:sodium transport system permease protein